MHKLHPQTTQFLGLGLILILCAGAMPAQQIAGSLSGHVTDQIGGAVTGATLLVIRRDGAEKRSVTNGQGVYVLDGLAPGAYRLRLEVTGFVPYENDQLNVEAGRRHTLDITLQATIEKQKVTVSSGDSRLSTDPERNASAVVLKGADLDALPDDPAALEATLRALAGPSAGPNGGQLYIDGFTASSAPQKSTIREIQINQNPFSAENDRIGFGRIEIFTRPGSGAFHGGAFGIFNDEVLNSRNPYAANRPAFQARAYGGSLSGPVLTKRASFFASVFRREIDDNAVINATVLDPGFKIVTLSEALTTPKRFFDLTPRFDYQVNKNNTLWARYSFSGADYEKAGVGQFSLPSRAFDSSVDEHTLQFADTAVLSKSSINEARFQYSHNRKQQGGDNLMPEVAVLEAFTGGGSQIGRSATSSNRWEAQNYTTLSLGRQTVKFGARLRGIELTDISSSNFGGTFTFTGGRGPALNERDQIIRDSAGHPVIEEITSIERYRRTLLFAAKGFSSSEIRAVGGGASLLTLASGDPRASVNQVDGGVFAQDDWRLDPFFTLSFGFRYEAQSNINNMNVAPRVAFAWSPRASFARPAKRVIRGGFGVFYDRVSESLTLQARRYSGENQQQYVVSAPGVLDLFPRVPSADEMAAFAVPQSVWRVAAGLRSPYTIQSSLSLEQQLPLRTTLTVSFINSRGLHYLRARNVNAPLPGTFEPASPSSGVRPLGLDGNVFEYESSGVLKQNLLVWNVTNRLNRRLTLFGVYIFSRTSSNTDGAGNFPASSFDLSGEFGRSSLDARHRVFVGGTVNLPRDLALNPLVLLSSGLPFNITTGIDSNGDSVFAERPALSSDTAEPGVRVTPFGAFTLNPGPGQSMIPRNFGNGPGVLLINLRLGKTIGFGHAMRSSTPGATPPRTATPARTPASEKPVKLTFAVLATNILNHVNRGVPIGNLSSPLFGRSNSVAGAGMNSPLGSGGNRRLDLQVNLAF